MSIKYSPKVKKATTDYLRTHDKASTKTLRESSRDNFLHERKEMEKELASSIENIAKLYNDSYRYVETQNVRGRNVMIFKNDGNKVKKIKFEFEENYHKAQEKVEVKSTEYNV